MKKDLKKVLPTHIRTRIAYNGRKIDSFFHVKDKTNAQHKFDLVYKVSCSVPTCNDTYIGEVGKRLMERIKDHSGRDKNSHLVKHSIETGHSAVTINDFEIIGSISERSREINSIEIVELIVSYGT